MTGIRNTSVQTFAMVAILTQVACAPPPILSLRGGARSYTADDYETVYTRWTRSRESFEFGQLEDVMAVTATYESWDFRWAYVVRYAQDYGLPPEQRTGILRTSLAEVSRQHRFFVTLAGSYMREGDLTSDRSAWRVLLVNEQGFSIAPIEIEKIKANRIPERVYFPTVSPFRQAFRIAFPAHFKNGQPLISAKSKRILLRFTGALGTVELVWKLNEPAAMISNERTSTY